MNSAADVLVIGGGGAACRAAIAAADAGATVILVSKKEPLHAGATCYPVAEMAGYNAGDPQDERSIEKHYDDILKAGQGMADPRLAAILAVQAPRTIEQLKQWGVNFEQEGTKDYVFKSCFSSWPRTHVIRGHGEPIVRAMTRQLALRPQVRVLSDVTIVELIVRDGQCVGAWGYTADGMPMAFRAGATVLATGGGCRIFERNLNPKDVTGDGYYLAWRAGAEMVNMEFMQIGVGFSHPVVNIFNGYLWEGRPVIKNAEGEEFLSRALPKGLTADDVMHEHRRHFPFSTSDCSKYLEIAIHKEICSGRGTKHGGVLADLSHMTDEWISALPDDCGISHMWPIAREYMYDKGVDLLREPVEICCFAHAVNGGVRIGTSAETSVPGLYAAGETAGGPHGADRLGGNMMVTCQVFGEMAGRNAAIHALMEKRACETAPRMTEEMQDLLHRQIETSELETDLHAATQRDLLVSRTEDGLKGVLKTVDRLEGDLCTGPMTDDVCVSNFLLRSQLMTARLMAQAALLRRESRGSHHRQDHPQKDEKQSHPIVLKKNMQPN